MKKIISVLAAALLLSLFAPCIAAQAEQQADGSYIVKLTDEQAASKAEELGLTEVYADAGLYRADSISEVKKLSGDVEYYEQDTKAYLIGDVEPVSAAADAQLMALTNDKYSSKQWSLSSVSVSGAWNAGYDGSGVKIAIIDSGIRATHEDLSGANVVTGYNTLNDTTSVTDETGHGSFVAGVIAASVNNSKGIAGLTENVTIVPIKCFGSDGTTDSSYIVKAIYMAVDTYDVDVINLSLGLTMNLQSMKQAVDYAAGKGVLIVAAAGNSGTTDLSYPAAYLNVVGVGSIQSSGTISSFSQRNSSVWVVAPGSDVVSCGYTSDTSYVKGNGTSFATPHVAAAAAVVKQYQPDADVDDFLEILAESSTDLGDSGYDTTYGYGNLNFTAIVSEMQSYDYSDDSDSVVISNPEDDDSVTVPDTTPPPDDNDDDTTDTDKIIAAFTDISGHWAYDYIAYCVGQRYFNGVTTTSFAPEWTMTRGMFVTVLSRMSGSTISGYYNTFVDVDNSMYYAQPIAWAQAKGIVDSQSYFYPDQSITRETMAAYLYRYAIAYGYTDGNVNVNVISSYSDYSSVSPWAVNGMAWAVKNGIINGRTTTTLCPGDTAKRSEVSAIIDRFDDIFKK